MRNYIVKPLRPIIYLLYLHIIALIFMSLFRILFFISVKSQISDDAIVNLAWIFKAFIRGLWFDNVIACYISAIPLIFTSIVVVFNIHRKFIYKSINIWFTIFYCITFMTLAGNIPYFCYFSKLLNASIWNWAEYGGTTLGMIFGESSYYLYIASFFAAMALFCFLIKKLRIAFVQLDQKDAGETEDHSHENNIKKRILIGTLSLIFISLCILGIRGRFGYNPIKVSAAYFCTSPVLNNLGVNPLFALLNSTLDELRPENKQLHLISSQEAIHNVQTYYNRNGINGISPIARVVTPKGKPNKQNVVLIMMESMSAKLMAHFGNKQHLTPNLDSLFLKSLSFDNCYSAGNHTNHGLYATLYSFPSIMFRNAMKGTNIPTYSGLPTILKENGYSTMFFMTHESQYDNMNAFFRTNGYNEIYSQENYPKEKIVNHFGVSDDYLFEYAIPVLRQHSKKGKPFFATLLTISNHPPYIVPSQYTDPTLTPEQQIVRYADDCIGKFMKKVSKEEWSKNTLFVFVGDHGKLVGNADCELPESFNHIPLIIHSANLQPQIREQFAGQVDIAPTILGILNIPYIQNNLGLDLLKDAPRPAAFYTADKTIAARNKDILYVYNAETRKEYTYKQPGNNLIDNNKESNKLKQYVFSLLQATEYLVQNNMTVNKRIK